MLFYCLQQLENFNFFLIWVTIWTPLFALLCLLIHWDSISSMFSKRSWSIFPDLKRKKVYYLKYSRQHKIYPIFMVSGFIVNEKGSRCNILNTAYRLVWVSVIYGCMINHAYTQWLKSTTIDNFPWGRYLWFWAWMVSCSTLYNVRLLLW